MQDTPQHNEAAQPTTDIPVGELLRRTRIHYRQSLEDVAHNLNIRPRQLDSIENGDLDALPAPVYTIGFVRAYADYLRLDTQQVVDLFKAQSNGAADPKCDLNFPVPKSENALPPLWIVLCGIGTAILICILWFVLHNAGEKVVPDVPVISAPIEYAPPIKDEGTPNLPPPTLQEPQEIIINVSEDSWVEVKDKNGAKLVARVLKKGELYKVPSAKGLVMTLGNAGGITLSIGNKTLKPIGKKGQILRDIPLDAEILRDQYGE